MKRYDTVPIPPCFYVVCDGDADIVFSQGVCRPYLYKDAFEHFIQPRLTTNLSNWDNLSHDRTFKKPNHVHPQEDKDWDMKTNEEKRMEWAE